MSKLNWVFQSSLLAGYVYGRPAVHASCDSVKMCSFNLSTAAQQFWHFIWFIAFSRLLEELKWINSKQSSRFYRDVSFSCDRNWHSKRISISHSRIQMHSNRLARIRNVKLVHILFVASRSGWLNWVETSAQLMGLFRIPEKVRRKAKIPSKDAIRLRKSNFGRLKNFGTLDLWFDHLVLPRYLAYLSYTLSNCYFMQIRVHFAENVWINFLNYWISSIWLLWNIGLRYTYEQNPLVTTTFGPEESSILLYVCCNMHAQRSDMILMLIENHKTRITCAWSSETLCKIRNSNEIV